MIFIVLDAIKSLGLNYDLVVKEHPMEDAHISFKDIQQRYPSIYWASKNSLQDLILNSSLIININSSVGFHALLFGKPVICLGKSTYARCGIIVNVTPLEPGWEGYVTLEFSNTTPLPAKIYANEGVAQFIFLKGNETPELTYADRNGKYMGQTGVTLPKV